MFVKLFKIVVSLAIYSSVRGNDIHVADSSSCDKNFNTATYLYAKNLMFPIKEIRNETGIYLNFSVRGESNAHIIFSLENEPQGENGNAYEIVLGSDSNRFSNIRLKRLGEDKAIVKSRDVLSKSEWRQFWIHITSKGDILVGKRNEGAFMTLRNSSENNIQINLIKHYAFSSWKDGPPLQWFIPCVQQKNNKSSCDKHFNTTKYQYDKNSTFPINKIRNETGIYLNFSVMGQSNAHIIFSLENEPQGDNGNAYEIVLGSDSNRFSNIRLKRLGEDKAKVNSSDVLSKSEWRQFWIHITSKGDILVGKRNEGAFMTLRNSSENNIQINLIKHYAFSSWKDGTPLQWFIPCVQQKNNPNHEQKPYENF